MAPLPPTALPLPPPPLRSLTRSSVPLTSWDTSTTSRMVGWKERSAVPTLLAACSRKERAGVGDWQTRTSMYDPLCAC
jgi:hypothetical protein